MNFASSRPKILILAVIAVLSLTACEQRGPQPPEITIHAIAEGYSTLTTPAEWNLREEELQPWQEHQAFSTSLRIQDAEGRDMAVLMTGGVGPIEVQGSPEGEKYTHLERGDSALAKENHFSFDAWRDDGQTASINLNFRPPEGGPLCAPVDVSLRREVWALRMGNPGRRTSHRRPDRTRRHGTVESQRENGRIHRTQLTDHPPESRRSPAAAAQPC